MTSVKRKEQALAQIRERLPRGALEVHILLGWLALLGAPHELREAGLEHIHRAQQLSRRVLVREQMGHGLVSGIGILREILGLFRENLQLDALALQLVDVEARAEIAG